MSSLSGKNQMERDQVPQSNQNVFVTAARTIALHESVLHCTANTATDNYTVTLPSVAEAAGLTFSIRALLIANSKAVTIAHAGDSVSWTNIVLDATGERATLRSNGSQWVVEESVVA